MRKSIASICCLAPTTRRSTRVCTLMDSRPLARQLHSSHQQSLVYWQVRELSVLPDRQKLLRHPCSRKRTIMTTSWITNAPSLLLEWTRAGPRLLMMASSSKSSDLTRTTYSRKALCLSMHSLYRPMPSSVLLCRVFSSKMKPHQLSEILRSF